MARGVATVSIPAGTTANTVVRKSIGGLGSILLQAANGATAILVYDNAAAAGGTVIGYIAASAVAGIYNFDMPASQGVVIAGASTNPAMTVSYY